MAGGWSIAARAAVSASVAWILLARSSALRACVQRLAAIGAPARFRTASAPAKAARSIPPRAAAGSQATSSPARGGRRTSRITSSPFRRTASTNAVPISPDDPVTAIRMGAS